MGTIVLERKETNERILISCYGFEWYKDNKLVKEGLIESFQMEEDVNLLLEEGFEII